MGRRVVGDGTVDAVSSSSASVKVIVSDCTVSENRTLGALVVDTPVA